MSKEYKVVEAKSAKELTIKVNEFIADGWNLAGGLNLSTSTDWRNKVYTQALFKITKE